MRGLVLEGGGARGAYQIGVVKSLYERGYSFDGFVGTSIGSINAAVLAQGDFDKALDLWANISLDQVFHEDELPIVALAVEGKNSQPPITEALRSSRLALAKIINNRGLCTKKMKNFLERYIDEDKIRNSGKDFGLVTISLSERKAHELMLEDIPHGQLINYLMASSSLPGFNFENIGGHKFMDGGIYNNCPSNLLINKDYDEIIAVRLTKLRSLVWVDDPKIKVISPSKDIGGLLQFTSESCVSKIDLGYNDGISYIDNLRK